MVLRQAHQRIVEVSKRLALLEDLSRDVGRLEEALTLKTPLESEPDSDCRFLHPFPNRFAVLAKLSYWLMGQWQAAHWSGREEHCLQQDMIEKNGSRWAGPIVRAKLSRAMQMEQYLNWRTVR